MSGNQEAFQAFYEGVRDRAKDPELCRMMWDAGYDNAKQESLENPPSGSVTYSCTVGGETFSTLSQETAKSWEADGFEVKVVGHQYPASHIEELFDATRSLRQHLALFCGPDDAIAQALFGEVDAIIAAHREMS